MRCAFEFENILPFNDSGWEEAFRTLDPGDSSLSKLMSEAYVENDHSQLPNNVWQQLNQ